ncbi:structural protein [Plastoroseomonas arctica]|uniref:structural protein n=1 Tax=Plastoroseomonas arctica TaxID=1509237 RepID=UPI001BABE531|nr:structural protein [Plastoroseomonas arctica]
MPDPKSSRGYRNRNPGNIDWSANNPWQGQVGKEDAPNGRFAVFESHEFGIRALASLLIRYQDRHGLDTVAAILHRWAPGIENDTGAYIAAVCRATGFAPHQRLDLHTHAHLRPLVEAIITHELGGQPYAAGVLDEGLRRAGILRPIETLSEAASTGTGQGAITVGSAAAAAATAAPALTALGGLPQWLGVALVIAAAAIAVAHVLTRRRAAA